MRRILVTGNAGAGKTSVGTALAAALRLPYVGLDRVVWQPGWVATPNPQRRHAESRIAGRSEWVVDGVSGTLLDAADAVIFLDVPRHRCLWRVFWRNLPYLLRSRPGLPERCPEVLIIPRLIKLIWRFPRVATPRILAVRALKGDRFFHVRSDADLKNVMDALGVPRLQPGYSRS